MTVLVACSDVPNPQSYSSLEHVDWRGLQMDVTTAGAAWRRTRRTASEAVLGWV